LSLFDIRRSDRISLRSILSISPNSVCPPRSSPRSLCHHMSSSEPHSLAVISEGGSTRTERNRERKTGRRAGGRRYKRRKTRRWRRQWPGAAEVGRRTCLHLFQRARRWVVTSRVGRHGNLLGLPKRGSIVLPVKTARDPDPTGSHAHGFSESRRVVAVWMEWGKGDSSSLERKSSVPPSLKSFVIIEH